MSPLADFLADERHVRVVHAARMPADWQFDAPAIREAARQLGIERPLSVTTRESGRWGGMWSWHTSAREHGITVLRRLTPEKANHTLWHELGHAAAYEADPNSVGDLGTLTQRRKLSPEAYAALPCERIADAIADANEHRSLILPLGY